MQHFSTQDAAASFGQVLDAACREPVAIERNGHPVAVLMSKGVFDEFEALKLERLRAAVDQGIAAIERGDYTELDEGELAGFADRIKTAGRRRRPE
ncbi:type II toxin-antitoxin system Phd/YefM family antitoxin [uncultured Thiodictyon sp.]|uniref:type II toxin-antitoxin system Phd/YefM family antitoxin n=1 Tax=uncultured Thiodictyon sp. TaxID=1846217 RepID=UPI0026015C98|nr:type II toxin-antitoxin system Phd/YefM family antitoxin [uncultured Thiodictyon sp.]